MQNFDLRALHLERLADWKCRYIAMNELPGSQLHLRLVCPNCICVDFVMPQPKVYARVGVTSTVIVWTKYDVQQKTICGIPFITEIVRKLMNH